MNRPTTMEDISRLQIELSETGDISRINDLAINGDDAALAVATYYFLKKKFPRISMLRTLETLQKHSEQLRAENKQASEILDLLDDDFSKLYELNIKPINGRVLYLILNQLGLNISTGKRTLFEAQLDIYCQAITKAKDIKVARSGGAGKSAKLDALRAETIRLYSAGKWNSVPLAAQDITPEIVALSIKNGPQLAPTTTKPLEWIRAHKKTLKNCAC